MNSIFIIIILGLIQGLTEFLPVSSTGHLILFENLLKGDFDKTFFDTLLVVIQLPSILAVVIYFYKDITPFVKDKTIFVERVNLWLKVLVGIIPAVILGLLFDDIVTETLSTPLVIAIMLIAYGLLFLYIESKFFPKKGNVSSVKEISYSLAFFIGIFQALAIIPGTSRSGATIVGGLILGLQRAVAAEFSFFLAIPTMCGAVLLRLLKSGLDFSSYEWLLIAIGSITSFIVSYVVIKWFMNYIKTKTFKVFGYYRVLVGIIIIMIALI